MKAIDTISERIPAWTVYTVSADFEPIVCCYRAGEAGQIASGVIAEQDPEDLDGYLTDPRAVLRDIKRLSAHEGFRVGALWIERRK